MNPAQTKTLLTLLVALCGALALVPQLQAYQAAFTFFAGALGGWAHGKRPGDMSDKDIEAAVSKRVEKE
jgi:hypothetical protein